MTVAFRGAGGIRLAADVAGDWDAPLVVLLHGGGQTRHSWGATTNLLAASGFLVVSLDLRGHGDSDWDPGGDYAMGRFADDVRAVLTAMQRPGALVGASLGGLAAMLAAGEAPQAACTSLVLVDVTPHMQEAGRQAITEFMLGYPQGFASVEAAADAVSTFLPHRPRPRDVSGLRRNLRQRDDGRFYWHWDRRTLTAPGGPRSATPPRFEAAVRAVQAPMLLVRGRLSDVVAPEDVRRFREMAPDAEYVDVADAAHMVAGDQNDAFATAIVEFLRRTRIDARV